MPDRRGRPRSGARLERGPLFHGWHDESQGWTLKRVNLLIGRMFHVGYTVQGVGKLLRRHGWSAQVPVRRAIEHCERCLSSRGRGVGLTTWTPY